MFADQLKSPRPSTVVRLVLGVANVALDGRPRPTPSPEEPDVLDLVRRRGTHVPPPVLLRRRNRPNRPSPLTNPLLSPPYSPNSL